MDPRQVNPDRGAPRAIEDWEKDTLEAWEEQRKKPWQPYVEATLGFRNHWYPAFFGCELPEGDVTPGPTEVRSEVILGERILFRRIGGHVYAVQDSCLHRGVRFSARPECYTKETLTCWYHGFTYDLRDGVLRSIVTDPNSPLVNKLRLRSYPVEERKGLVFVFVGDVDPPPPLEEDVQPGFLDAALAVYPEGSVRTVKCNWRPAAENGFDPAHAYIHRDSLLVRALRIPTVLGDAGISRSHGMEIVESTRPAGVRLLRGQGTPIWDAEIDAGVTISARFKPGQEGVLEGMVPDVSIWLPCGLKVDPFPSPDIIHFEWYVPIDENNHRYIMTWGRYVETPEDEAKFREEVKGLWKDMVTNKFTNEDIFAREGEPYFRSIERQVIWSLLPQRHAVVATGGGTFVDPENRAAINADGVSVWIDVPFDVLLDRIPADGRRPLANDRVQMAMLYENRRLAYQQAHLCLDASRARTEELVEQLIEQLE